MQPSIFAITLLAAACSAPAAQRQVSDTPVTQVGSACPQTPNQFFAAQRQCADRVDCTWHVTLLNATPQCLATAAPCKFAGTGHNQTTAWSQFSTLIIAGSCDAASLAVAPATAFRQIGAAGAGGKFFLVRDTGKRCAAAPCFSLEIAELNSPYTNAVSSLNLRSIAAGPSDQAAFAAAITSGVIIAGRVFAMPEGLGMGKTLVGTQLFVPLEITPFSNTQTNAITPAEML